MAVLESHGHEISSIFQLLGEKENDITLSMAWTLARCPEFLKKLVFHITGVTPDPDQVTIMNQRYDAAAGITDIEITDHRFFHIIIEAKRGWQLPGSDQLTKYSLRTDFIKSKAPKKYIVTLSECSADYARVYLPFTKVNNIPIKHLPYSNVYQMVADAIPASSHEGKHLLWQFLEYLKGIMTMQKSDSNMVYVVALGSNRPENCCLTWIGIVTQHHKYFHPVGGHGWPKEPPNYIAFRYHGQLQSIHHVDSYVVTRNMHDEVSDMPDEVWDTDHFVYRLGPAITPNKTVKTGKLFRNGRVWAMIDTLLTCDTISEARDLTQSRL